VALDGGSGDRAIARFLYDRHLIIETYPVIDTWAGLIWCFENHSFYGFGFWYVMSFFICDETCIYKELL
jgi:hypothetical protein